MGQAGPSGDRRVLRDGVKSSLTSGGTSLPPLPTSQADGPNVISCKSEGRAWWAKVEEVGDYSKSRFERALLYKNHLREIRRT